MLSRPAVRLVPPIDGGDVATLGVDSDGTRRLVAYGLRLLTHSDGTIETAHQFFPLARNVQSVELPERLGGGFVFSLIVSGRTAFWKSATWTSALAPFAEVDFELERLVVGFDRLYLQARRTGEWAALDPNSGKGLDLGSLPRSPNFGAMVFVDEWFGAVELPVRGTVVTFDAGNRWHRVGLTTLGLGQVGSELLIVTPEGRRALGPDGALRGVDSGGEGRDAGAPRRVTPEGPLGPSPLRTAILRGFPDGSDSAVVAAGGTLARVRLSDGRVLESRSKAVSASSTCVPVRLGKGHGFVCGEPHGKTAVHAFEPPLSLRVVEEFESPRSIGESGNGALVIRGRCSAGPQDAVDSAYCIRAPGGSRWELASSVSPGGLERVVALRDGRAALISAPRGATRGTLTLIGENGQPKRLPLVLERRDNPAESLLRKGFWLDGFVEAADGSLRGWVTGQGVFAGVRIGLDGKVRTGQLQRTVERTLFSGERALIIPSAGIAEQTTDGGMSWSDAELPVEIELDPTKAPSPSGKLEQGCSQLGCVFLGWLRIGWNGRFGAQPLAVANAPSTTVLPSPGGGRWSLRCSPTAEQSPPLATLTRGGGGIEPVREDGQAHWQPLLETAPPVIPRDAVAFDTGSEGVLRAYAWAPRGTEFGKTGRFQVAVNDRYRVAGGVWKTLAAQSPWDDAVQVAEVFGYEGSSPSVWNVTLDASGRSGVLSVSARGSTDLFGIEEDRAPQLLVNASRHGIGAVTSAVRVGSSYFVSAQEDGRAFRIFAVEGGRARLVGQYSDVALGRTISPVLVRSTRGDALGIWGRSAGWYVFPLDAATGAIDPPIEITAKQLSRLPSPCDPDEEGYLLEGPVGIDPFADFLDGADDVSARAFEGRFVASANGLCVRELVARSETALDPAVRPKSPRRAPSAPSVPLVLSDRASGGRRHGFVCGP